MSPAPAAGAKRTCAGADGTRDRTEEVDLTEVIFDMSTSLDGFVKASNATPEQPLDEGGERLHGWVFGEVCPRLPVGRCVLAPPPDTTRVARRKEVNPMPD